MGLMGLMGTIVFKSQRTDGAASGESCLHELSQTERAASAEASLLALCRVAFEEDNKSVVTSEDIVK